MNSLRRDKMLHFIEEHESATLKQLHALFPQLSTMTIHRDLEFLAQKGAIRRIWGGAQVVRNAVEAEFEEREQENSSFKNAMAKKAVSLIKPGDSIFLDAGTSCFALAKLIPDIDINIFTIGPNIAIELMKLNRPSINICGGNLNRSNLSLSGQNTLEMISDINIDMAFVGSGGYSHESGFTGGKESEARVKSLVVKKARVVVAMTDSSKIGKTRPFPFAKLQDFHYIIDDGRLPGHVLSVAADLNITVL
ncbi:MAG: DeoR/GlpR transcriptional regulator [Clostridiales bacterium]|nr:DeoR/GlpR transcriptional regulator [Clostridiales bacterium]